MASLLDILYSINCRLSSNPRIFERIKINSAIRFGIRVMANNVLPLVYTKSSHMDLNRTPVPIVVSLTSFPARIGKIWLVVESLLRQKTPPERIVLWLSRDQFPDEYGNLPKKLLDRRDRGLDIRFVDGDFRSHKKYYYAFREYPEKFVLTIDDDLLFPSTFIKDVYQCALEFPNSVIANFGSKFKWDSTHCSFESTGIKIRPKETGTNLFFGSGGGTLFQPKRLLPYLDEIETIYGMCPTADDIYLNYLIRLAGMEVTFKEVSPLLSIVNKNDVKLTDHNGHLYSSTSRNAVQLRHLVEYSLEKNGINPFAIQ